MTPSSDAPPPPLSVWIVDPIGYTGLIYYDLSLATALAALGVDATLVASDSQIGGLATRVPERAVFRGTSTGSRVSRGLRHGVSLARLVGLAITKRPSVMHWQYLAMPAFDVPTIWFLRRLGLRQVFTAHEIAPWGAGRLVRWLMRRLYRSVDGIVVHHEQDLAGVHRLAAGRSSRTAVIEHGAFELFADPELPQSAARTALGLSLEQPLALFFGSLRRGKGLEDLLTAWPAVVRELPDARLLICGKPSRHHPREWVLAAVADTGAARSVSHELEQVDTAKANACYRAADVVVLPYREITTSGVLRYAWSSARPVVATSVGEHEQLVTPNVGILVPSGDPAALTAAVVALLSDRTAAAEMGREALRTAQRDLSWATTAAETRSFYLSILGDA